ncbi:MAG: SDR family oxidoreductase [Chloroflexi bacterium]|nr:SDR family oxidoreductase [Chloroflexota bacterium]
MNEKHFDRKQVANLILFLASDEASYLTGQQFVIDGGFCPPQTKAEMPEGQKAAEGVGQVDR